MATARNNAALLGMRVGARVRLDGRTFTVREASPPEFVIENNAGKSYLLAVVHGQSPVYAPVAPRSDGGVACCGQWVTVKRHSFVQAAAEPTTASSRPTRRDAPARRVRTAPLREVPRQADSDACQALIEEVIALARRKGLIKGVPSVDIGEASGNPFHATLVDRRRVRDGGLVPVVDQAGGSVLGALRNLLGELELRPPADNSNAAVPKAAKPKRKTTKKPSRKKSKPDEAASDSAAVTTSNGITYYRNVQDRTGHVDVGQHADVKPRAWIRIHSKHRALTFKVGQAAVYDGEHISHTGIIVAIGKSTVTIKLPASEPGTRRLSIYRFAQFNRDYALPPIPQGPSTVDPKPTVTTKRGVTFYRNVKSKDRRLQGHVYPGEVQVGRHADVRPGAWIRIHGHDRNTNRPFDLTFRIGDEAVHGAYNLVYTGEIISIGKSTVAIKGTSRTKRLTIDRFVFWNRNYDAERIAERNADTGMMI